MNQYDVVVRPIVTEKSSLLKEAGNQYVFEVARSANKIEIAKAVEQLFKVQVLSVRVMNMEGKTRRLGNTRARSRTGARPSSSSARRTKFLSLKVHDGSARI